MMQKPGTDDDIEGFLTQRRERADAVFYTAADPENLTNLVAFFQVSTARLDSDNAFEWQIGKLFEQPPIVAADVSDRELGHLLGRE